MIKRLLLTVVAIGVSLAGGCMTDAAYAGSSRHLSLTPDGFFPEPTRSSCASGDTCNNGALFNYERGIIGVNTSVTRNKDKASSSSIEAAMSKRVTHTVSRRASYVDYTVHWTDVFGYANADDGDAAQHGQSLLRFRAVVTGCSACTFTGRLSHTIAWNGDQAVVDFEGDPNPSTDCRTCSTFDQTVRMTISDGSPIPAGTTVELRPTVVSHTWMDADDVDQIGELLAPTTAYREPYGTADALPASIEVVEHA